MINNWRFFCHPVVGVAPDNLGVNMSKVVDRAPADKPGDESREGGGRAQKVLDLELIILSAVDTRDGEWVKKKGVIWWAEKLSVLSSSDWLAVPPFNSISIISVGVLWGCC